ncbi:MAG: hypothetical protein M1510_04635 [Nitrospirae bacterium]|nr:hypothetical protein [Nitrospirota bacterium]MCL5237347.1 hypothetical protein [Nitrospirota bacterium]
MKHGHKYEPLFHHGVTSDVMELGIQAAEIRKCKKCEKQAVFVLTKKGRWVPLLDEQEAEGKDVLLA